MEEEQARKYRKWRKRLKRIYRKFALSAAKAVKYDDAENVHRARVNCRKLLTLLSVLDPNDRGNLRDPLRIAFRALGKVRDGDVLLEEFGRLKEREEEEEIAEMLKRFLKIQKDRREHFRGELAGKLHKAFRKKFRRRWKHYLLSGLGVQSTEVNLPLVLRNKEEAIDKLSREIEPLLRRKKMELTETAAKLHRARLLVKELRYVRKEAGFALKTAGSPVAAEKIRREKRLQEQLGLVNDCRVRLARWGSLPPHDLDVEKERHRQFSRRLRKELTARIRDLELDRAGD